MTSMTLLFIALIVAGIVLLVWRSVSAGNVREIVHTEKYRPMERTQAELPRRADLAYTEFAEEWGDRELPAPSAVPVQEQPASLHSSLQQIEETESDLSDSLLHSLQQQLSETAAMLRQVEQHVMTLHALEPFLQEWQPVQQWQLQSEPDTEPSGGQPQYDI